MLRHLQINRNDDVQEQLRLRRQQLAALACLLRTEAELLAVNALHQVYSSQKIWKLNSA